MVISHICVQLVDESMPSCILKAALPRVVRSSLERLGLQWSKTHSASKAKQSEDLTWTCCRPIQFSSGCLKPCLSSQNAFDSCCGYSHCGPEEAQVSLLLSILRQAHRATDCN